jgi:hypothetical protein
VPDMTDKEDELRSAVEKKHYVRASNLAVSLGASQERIEDLRKEALWQISAGFRNAAGTRILAEQQGLSKKHVEDYLRKRSEEERSRGNAKILEPTFDHNTNRYLTFEEWSDYLVRKWDKLSLAS